MGVDKEKITSFIENGEELFFANSIWRIILLDVNFLSNLTEIDDWESKVQMLEVPCWNPWLLDSMHSGNPILGSGVRSTIQTLFGLQNQSKIVLISSVWNFGKLNTL